MRDSSRFRVAIEPLDLDQTLGCGQTFRWNKLPDGSWNGVLDRDVVRLKSTTRQLSVEAFPGNHRAKERVLIHLRASDDVRDIQKRLSEDAMLSNGLAGVSGLRLVKMPPWECMVSYVLATNSNIKRISRMIEAVADRFGDDISEGKASFPDWNRLRNASVDELTGCGLGYRAKYVHALCRSVDDGVISRMERLSYEDLRLELKELPGIGDKVADCVSLFGFGHLDSFPIDVWVERSLKRLYRVTGSYAKLRAFAAKRFGPFAGYAQEYLYYNEWCLAQNGGCAFSKD